VATGSYGLAIVDASNFQSPVVLSQLALGGNATDVAVDTALGLAAVADGSGGLQIVNVADPTKPKLVQTISINANAVRVIDGIAYANDGSKLDAFDLATGQLYQTLALGNAGVTAMASDGTTLYTIDSSNTLRIVDTSSGSMVLQGLVALSYGGYTGDRLFVANGIAYVSGANGFTGDYATVDVSNPTAPKLIEGPDATNLAGTAIALNGSGLGVLVGNPGGVFGTNVVDVVTTSDATKTGQQINRYTLPTVPYDVAIGDGIAFVADGTGGLQVVNYRSFDTQGVPPTVTITQPPADQDPNTPGIQVTEGSTITFGATVADDVQVRNAEVLINGAVVTNSVSYPWDLSAQLPTIAANGSNQVTSQVEAIDTGGNTTLSAPIALQLVRDTTPPQLLSANISEGAFRGQTFRAFVFDFSKSLNESTVNAQTFSLIGPGNLAVAPQSIQFRNNDRVVQLTYPTLALGQYQFDIAAPSVTDRAGNALGSTTLKTDFTVVPFTAIWNNPSGGNWSVASNWLSGQLPVSTDTVLIGLPAGNTVSFSSGSTTVGGLSIEGGGTLAVSGGVLTDTGGLQVVNGVLQLAGGGTISQAIITNQGGTIALSGGTLDGVTYQGPLDLSAGSASVIVKDGITLTGANGSGSGTINLTGPNSVLYASGTEAFDNATLNIGNNSTDTLYDYDPSAPAVLSFGPQFVINQTGSNANLTGYNNRSGSGFVNAGTINAGFNGGSFTIGATSFTNQGTINVSNGDTLNINSSGWSNTGAMNVSGGTLNLGSTFTTAQLGTVNHTGGTVNVTGTLDNTGTTLKVGTGTGLGTLTLSGTIMNGTIASTGFGLAAAGGILDGVIYQGELDLGNLDVKDGFTGGVGGATINMMGAGSTLYAQGTQTFDNATLNIGNNSGDTFYDYDSSAAAAVTFGSHFTVNQTGSSASFNNYNNRSGSGFVNAGTINAALNGGSFAINGPSFTNQGTINISNGDTLSINSNSWSNTGAMNVSGGTLNLGGSFTTAQLGTVTHTGGIVNVTGTLDNAGTTLNIGTGTGLGTLTLSGTIKNGTIASTGFGLAAASGILDSVIYQGELDLGNLYVQDGFTGGVGGATINHDGRRQHTLCPGHPDLRQYDAQYRQQQR
jgi:hypothetical protein